jgi:hypothetical protein
MGSREMEILPYCQLDMLVAKNHPLWSSRLSPSDFQLFGPLKIHLAGKQFATDTDVKQKLQRNVNSYKCRQQ